MKPQTIAAGAGGLLATLATRFLPFEMSPTTQSVLGFTIGVGSAALAWWLECKSCDACTSSSASASSSKTTVTAGAASSSDDNSAKAGPGYDEIAKRFADVQDLICNFLKDETGDNYKEDLWNYDKGQGGGRTRVWENGKNLEKAGVNLSTLQGGALPATAATAIKIAPNTPYSVTGVSLVIHPRNPWVPTIHMNIRYFQAGDKWWFGGGIDLTPYCPRREEVAAFHACMRDVCVAHGMDYPSLKKQCDDYFTIRHRNEMRGVGGIFFDHLCDDRAANFEFVTALGEAFVRAYQPFWRAHLTRPYTPRQREFQLLRRGRYAEFNLIYDRGTKFGLESNGRTESILMSLPAECIWRYGGQLSDERDGGDEQWNSANEKEVNEFYIQPQDWTSIYEASTKS